MKKIKLIAFIAALVAGLCLFQFLRMVSKPEPIPRTNVVVALVDIPVNKQITEDMVTLKPVVTESLLSDCLTETQSVVGKVASGEIFAGEQITRKRLVELGGSEGESNTLAYVVQPGKRAITVGVDEVTGIGYLLKPGNTVDIIYSYTEVITTALPDGTTEKVENPKARLLFQNIEILAVDAVMSKAGAEEYSTVTLSIDADQETKYILASQTGSLRLALRSPLDTKEHGEMVIEVKDIIGESEEE